MFHCPSMGCRWMFILLSTLVGTSNPLSCCGRKTVNFGQSIPFSGYLSIALIWGQNYKMSHDSHCHTPNHQFYSRWCCGEGMPLEVEVPLLAAGQQGQAGRRWWRQRSGWHIVNAGLPAHMTSSRLLHWC